MSHPSAQRTAEIYRQGIPITLRHYPYWLVTRDKRPILPSRWSDTDRLLTFDEALDRLSSRRSADGIAYAFQQEGPFVGVDFDDVRDPDTSHVDPEVEELISGLNSYTEISSSGTGFHILLTGERDLGYLHKGEVGTGHVEIFDADRYFVLTADRYRPDELPENPKPADKAFISLEGEYLKTRGMDSKSGLNHEREDVVDGFEPRDSSERQEGESSLPTPAQVRVTGRKYDDHFDSLWRGSPVNGITDQSKLDFKLVCRLVFWCRRNPLLIDECFRESGRYGCRPEETTPKWDQIATKAGLTHGENMISKGLWYNEDSYTGQYSTPE